MSKRVGGHQGVVREAVKNVVVGKLHQHHCGDGRLRLVEAGNSLWNVVFEHAEIFFLQPGDEHPVFGHYAHVQRDQGHVYAHRESGHAFDLLGRLWGLFFFRLLDLLFGHRNGPYIARGTAGFATRRLLLGGAGGRRGRRGGLRLRRERCACQHCRDQCQDREKPAA